MTFSKNFSIAMLVMASFAASSAFAADDGGLPKPKPDVGTPKTRTEVKAERAAAAKSGELNKNSSSNPMGDKTVVATKKSRSDVKGETAAAKKADGGTLKTPRE